MAIEFAKQENPRLSDVEITVMEEQLRNGNVEALLYFLSFYHPFI